jgi:Glycosyltransferase family 87
MPMPPPRKLHVFAAMFFWGVLLSFLLVTPRVFNSPEGADFSTFYTAGKIVQRGQSRQLYDWPLQTQVQSEFSRSTALRNRALPYLRPPFEALLFLPLSYLPYIRAFEVWIVLSALLVGLTAAFLRMRIPDLPAIPWWLYYPAIFCYGPIAHGFSLGQDFALLLFLFALVMVCFREGKDFRAGCFLGLALIKFQLVLPLLIVLILKRQCRALAGFSTVAVLLSGVGVWLLGWNGMLAYPAYLWRLNQIPTAAGIWPSMMPSLRGLLQGWGNMHSSRGLDLLIGVLSLILLVWAARQWDTTVPRGSKFYLAGVATMLLIMQLAGYHASGYDMSLLFPVIVWAANAGLYDDELDVTTRRALLLGSAVLLCAPLYLVLIRKGQVNLLALALFVLAWGYARAIRVWQSQRNLSVPVHSSAS